MTTKIIYDMDRNLDELIDFSKYKKLNKGDFVVYGFGYIIKGNKYTGTFKKIKKRTRKCL